MKCPYCAEDIKDDAMVCRYCRQNLMVFKSFLDRISQIEDRLVEIAASITSVGSSLNASPSLDTPASSKADEKSSFEYWFLLPGLLPVLLTAVGYWLFRFVLTGPPAAWIFLVASALTPLPFGLWLGLRWRGSRPIAYIVIGTLVGIGDALAILLVFWVNTGDVAPVWLPGASGYVLGHALMFTSGGLVGDWIKKKRSPVNLQRGYAAKLARKVVGSADTSPEGNSRVKRFAEIITALAPILTFLGSIVAAYLSYKATTNKTP